MAIVNDPHPVAGIAEIVLPESAQDREALQVAVQQRAMRVLASVQILGGMGVAAGAAVGALLAADLSSESFSGVAASASVVGAAVIALPVSRIMNARGRRPGLIFAYLIALTGASLIVLGAILGIFPLAMLGLFLAGGGNAATLQSRYAATDLAPPERRGRALATVVWATTLGSVVGPNLASPLGNLAERMSVPRLAGPYMLSMLVYVLSMIVVATLLRPDPLLTARALQGEAADHKQVRHSFSQSFDLIVAHPSARVGLGAMMIGQAVMTAVMSMTPLHIKHAGESLTVVGLVISLHIVGMYAFSPLVGMAVDRIGRRFVIGIGGAILLLSFVVSGTASGSQTAQLSVGLLLLGLGWSCTMIAGSTLLSESMSIVDRPSVQGAADLLMGVAGASAGLVAGVVVSMGSYSLLNVLATLLVVPMLFATWRLTQKMPVPQL